MGGSPSKTVEQPVMPSSSSSSSGNSDTRQQELEAAEVAQPETPSSSSSGNSDTWQQELEEAEAYEERMHSVMFRGFSSMTQHYRLHAGFPFHHDRDPVEQPVTPRRSIGVRQPVIPSSSSSGNSDTRLQALVEAEVFEWMHSKTFRGFFSMPPPYSVPQSVPFLHHRDPDKTLVKRSSFEFLPPNFSELRVVLLGSSWSERSSVGNFILGETKFNTEEEPDHCLRVEGRFNEKEIVLINTPDLLPSSSFHKRLIETCKSLSDPGPHVFLILIQPEDFTRMDELELCRVLELFSDQSFHNSLVLISTPREESSGFMERYIQDPAIKEMIRKCKYRFLWRKNLEHPQLLTRLGQVVKENNGEHVH